MLFNKIQKNVADLMPKIYDHPFNQELANGSLPIEKFTFYLAQDALYLTDFAKALALTANRLPHAYQTEIFKQFAINAIQSERELHANTLKKYSVPRYLKQEQSPFCFMYTNYLLKMAHAAPVEEAVASLLPCFWIYQQVGQRAYAKKTNNNPYQDWIDLYAHAEFDSSVNLAIKTLNELGDTASPAIKKNMTSAFNRATQLEWYFWEGAYTQQTWYLCNR